MSKFSRTMAPLLAIALYASASRAELGFEMIYLVEIEAARSWCEEKLPGFGNQNQDGFARWQEELKKTLSESQEEDRFQQGLQQKKGQLTKIYNQVGSYFIYATCDDELLSMFLALGGAPKLDPKFTTPQKTWDLYVQSIKSGDYGTMISCLAGQYEQDHMNLLGREDFTILGSLVKDIRSANFIEHTENVVELSLEYDDGISATQYFGKFNGNWKLMGTTRPRAPVRKWQPMGGQILDVKTQRPIAGAVVVAKWNAYPRCFHVETAMTDADGRYYFDAWENTANTAELNGQEVLITAYKAEYQHAGNTQYRNEITVRPWANEEKRLRRKYLLERAALPAQARIGHLLSRVSATRSCDELEDDSRQHLYELYDAIYHEAISIAESEEDVHNVKRIRYWSLKVLAEKDAGTVTTLDGEAVELKDPGSYIAPVDIKAPIRPPKPRPGTGFGSYRRKIVEQ